MTLTLLLIINSCNTSTVATRLTPSLLERFPLLPSLFLTTRGSKVPASSRDIRTSKSRSLSVAYWFPYLFPRVKPDWQSCGWFSSPVCLGICSLLPTMAAWLNGSENPQVPRCLEIWHELKAPFEPDRWSFWSNAYGFRDATMWLSTGISRVNHAAFLVSAEQRHPFDFPSVLG